MKSRYVTEWGQGKHMGWNLLDLQEQSCLFCGSSLSKMLEAERGVQGADDLFQSVLSHTAKCMVMFVSSKPFFGFFIFSSSPHLLLTVYAHRILSSSLHVPLLV